MQTTTLCSFGVFSSATNVLALPARIADLTDRRRRVLEEPRAVGRIAQALATTRAPLRGPTFFS